MKTDKLDKLPTLTPDQLSQVWGGVNGKAVLAERQEIDEMALRPARPVDGWGRVVGR